MFKKLRKMLCLIGVFFVYSNFVKLNAANIIFDLNGVLFATNKMVIARKVGLLPMMCHIFFSWKNPRAELFSMLDTIEPFTLSPVKAFDEHGKQLPDIMCDWLKGVPSCVIRERILESFETPNIITDLACALFDPEVSAKTQEIVLAGQRFVEECKEKGHSVYVLSNWDADSFEIMQKKYPEFWALFDGIVISGHCGLIKPDKKIFNYLLTEYNLDPETCFFLDNQLENVKAAYEEHIYGTVVTTTWGGRPDFAKARHDLQSWYEQYRCAA